MTTIVLRPRKLDHGAIVKMGLHAFLHRQGAYVYSANHYGQLDHNSAACILGEAADYARQGQVAALKVKAEKLAQ